MKKKIILLSAILALVLSSVACSSNSGKGDPFKGTWRGTMDLTKQFNDGVIANYPDLEKHVAFTDLVFILDITFEDGNMTMKVEEDSVKSFMANFEAGMENIGKGALEEWLVTRDLTLEEVIAESGMDEEIYLNDRYGKMGIVNMTEAMKSVTNESLEGLSKLVGPYTYDNETIKLHFENNTFESISYEFEGDTLILRIKGEGFTLRIDCEK